MRNFQNTIDIKLNDLSLCLISMNYDGSQFIILRYTQLMYYRKVGKSYQIQQNQSNFICYWDIQDFMLHPYENYLGVVHRKSHKIYYTFYRYSGKHKKWLIHYNKWLLNVDNSLHFPLKFSLNPSLDLINTNCNQPLLEDLIGIYQFQVRQHAKKLRRYRIQGDRIKYFDQQRIILSICHKKLIVYKYYHFQPLHVYNAKCNIFDITFNDQGLVFIFCTSGLIIWNLQTLKKQQIIKLDPILKSLNSQLELYFLIGAVIFSTSHQTYYSLNLNLDENKEQKIVKGQKEYQNFISNAKGNIYFLLEYHQSKGQQNKLRVFEQQ